MTLVEANHCDDTDRETMAICCSVNKAPEKHWNVSAVGAGVGGQPEAKAGGIYQNRGWHLSIKLSKQEAGGMLSC